MDNGVRYFIQTLSALKDSTTVSFDQIKTCRDALNAIIDNKATCANLLYTINTDKLAFGCIVMPKFRGDEVNNLLISGDPIRIQEIEVEIDSKLFDYGLSEEQIAMIILYNICHMVNDDTPTRRVREAIDTYLMNHDTQLVIKESVQYQPILALGVCDALVQFTNCMYLDNEIESDPFLDNLGFVDYSFGETLADLYKVIPGADSEIARRPRLNMLDWALRLYVDVKKERIPALHLLDKCKDIVGSTLYKNKFQTVINCLHKIDTDSYVQEMVNEYITEAKKKKTSLFSQIKYAGLRGIEEDFYEFMVRARNAETEEEVMYALKQINVRLAILDDYLRNEEMSDADRQRWTNLYNKYVVIRDDIANKKVYNKRNYGIFVDYNRLDELDKQDNEDYDY